ncbi:MAG: hypothetical protein LBR08_05220 [Bacteroidales bacterium]|nr:hypothetical protein [Bacteroidales bacterium]
MYKCYACGRQFLNTRRIDAELIWREYSTGKQIYNELAVKYGCSARTVQRKIDSVKIAPNRQFPAVATVVMFGRAWGVMVFKNSLDGQILYFVFVKHETLLLYGAGIKEIRRRGIIFNQLSVMASEEYLLCFLIFRCKCVSFT